jgi:hypothetical protein
MTTALEFLKSVLPDEGYKCATVINDSKKWNQFFATTEELCKFILQQDALGRTVYHACASYKVPQSDPKGTPRSARSLGRTKSNALGARAFWLDIDAGPGKPYESATAAALAVQSFVGVTHLPQPVYIGSGVGLHVYWPLDALVGRDDWERYAEGLKRLCQREGLAAGPERTADISSILRTPGTHHRKDGAKLVRAGELVGPYSLGLFGKFLEGENASRTRTTEINAGRLVPARTAGRSVPSIIAAAGNIHTDEPRWTEPAARACGQLRRFALSGGNLPEPDWYAALGVLSFCVDGPAYAHAWSSRGYEGYSYGETAERLARVHEFGPTTCARFEALNPADCAGCPFKGQITSPIQLGRNKAHAESGADRSGRTDAEGQLSPFGEAEEKDPRIPDGYTIKDGALCFVHEKTGGTPTLQKICGFPVFLDSVQTGEVNQDFSLSMTLKMPQEGERKVISSARTFFSGTGISEMAAQGVIVHDTDLFRRFVRDSMDNYNTNKKLERRYDQFGWKDDDTSFLFGGNLYTANGITPVIGSDEIRLRSQYLGPRRNGSIDQWRAAANQLFATGHEPQSFALLASLAAPLMRFHASGEGGAIISLVSDRSGTGKTTALEAAASVWGRLKGTQIIDDDTSVAKGLKLAVFGNIACTYDELFNRDPEVIRRFVLMFTNGRDRDRGTADGNLRHVRAEWQTILLLASNNSIVDILSSMDGTDAPAYRVLEFTLDPLQSTDKKRGDALRKQLDDNSGYAADLYLRSLLQPQTLTYIKDALPRWTDQVWKKTLLNPEHRFWVRAISSVIAAGTIVKHAGILDFSVDRIAGWAMEYVQGKRNVTEGDHKFEPVSLLVRFLDQHLMDTLVVNDVPKSGPGGASQALLEPRRNLLVRNEMKPQRIFIEELALRRWLIDKGANTDTFIKELRAMGIFTRLAAKTLGAGTTHATGQVKAWEVDASIPAMSGHLKAVAAVVDHPKRGHQREKDERLFGKFE